MATPPRRAPAAAASANAGMSLSAAGRAALVLREGLGGRPGNRGGHYDDSAGNCTVGVGTLVHYGPCTAAEWAERANPVANQATLSTRIASTEAVVRRRVATRSLNQNQFDALVSAG